MSSGSQIVNTPNSVYLRQNDKDIIFVEELDAAEKYGKKLYQSNSTYQKIANVMEHPEFRSFFDKYFNDWDDIKTVIMFMKVYEMIEKRSNEDLNGYQKIAFLDAIMKDSDTRRHIIDKTLQTITPYKSTSKFTSNFTPKNRLVYKTQSVPSDLHKTKK